jgi:Predicted flavoprotein
LRAASVNAAVLEAAQALRPPGVEIVCYGGLGALPLYNFDFDGARPPEPVRALRRDVVESAGLLIATPEYAHGIAAPMKNALDWLVGDVDLPGNRSRFGTPRRARRTPRRICAKC